jgi:glucan phosphoethanolaminetransferase (alkaline phosphatase superfamily)
LFICLFFYIILFYFNEFFKEPNRIQQWTLLFATCEKRLRSFTFAIFSACCLLLVLLLLLSILRIPELLRTFPPKVFLKSCCAFYFPKKAQNSLDHCVDASKEDLIESELLNSHEVEQEGESPELSWQMKVCIITLFITVESIC